MAYLTKEQNTILEKELLKFFDKTTNYKSYLELANNLKFATYNIVRYKVDKLKKENPILYNNRIFIREKCNNSYFDKIDSKNKTYLLGLIVSDGHVGNTKSGLKFTSIDKEIVSLMCKELNVDEKYIKVKDLNSVKGQKNVYYSISIYSKDLLKQLNKLNITKNKEKLINFDFSCITKELIAHFIRGLFDGDGCISFTRKGNNRNSYKPTLYICNLDLTFIKKLDTIFKENSLDFNIYFDSKIYYLKTGSKEMTFRFKEFIYKDCENSFIIRKKEKFNMLIPR